MSGGGSQTTTSSSTVPPQFLNAYQSTVDRATQVASTPYQAYTGNLVAGFSGDQTQAQQQVRNLQGGYQPYLNSASSDINASTQPLWSNVQQSGVAPGSGIAGYTKDFYGNAPGVNAQTIAQYENPYQSQVIAATQGQIANTDAQQFAQLGGNAASAGAFGGDRMGVAQGVLGGQQAIANNATLAGLNQANYSQALGEANQQQGTAIAADEAATQLGQSEFNTQQQNQLGANEANAWLNSQAGYANANLANESNSLGLTNASALSQSGLTQQQQQQAGLNTAYEQWQAQQAFPYQQTGWLANITEGIGSNVGGNSTSTTTQNKDGGRIGRAGGGIVPNYDTGGAMYGTGPYGYGGQGSILSEIPNVATSFIPAGGSSGGNGMGHGPPTANAPAMQPGPSIGSDIGAASGAVSLYKNLGLGGMFGSGASAAAPVSSAAFAPGMSTLTMPAAASVAADPAALAAGSGASGAGFLGSLGSAVEAGAADVGSAVASGAGAIGGALSGAAAGIGSGIAAGASAIGGGLDWLISLLALKDGGVVEAPAQPKASGGIVIPFPQDRVRRASGGGIGGAMPYSDAPPVQANGTYGASYMDGITGAPGAMGKGIAASQPAASSGGFGGGINAMASSGALGIIPSMFARGGGIDVRALGGGIDAWGGGGSGPLGRGGAPDLNASSNGASPFSMGPSAPNLNAPRGLMLRRGGIVPHFADGGSPAPDDTWSGTGSASSGGADSWTDPSSDQFPAPSSSAPASSFTAEKPNLWLPALAGIATAVAGHHANAGRNIAEGVLAGLNTYGSEDQRYQQGREKAASLDQEAKKLADDAEFHRENIANENLRTQQLGAYQQSESQNSAARIAAEIAHNQAMEGIDRSRAGDEASYHQGELGVRSQELGIQSAAQKSLEAWRNTQGMATTPIGTNPADGSMIYGGKFGSGTFDAAGNPYTGRVAPMPAVAARVGATERGQDLQHGDRQAEMDQTWQLKTAGMNQADREGIRKAADTIYSGAMTNGHPMTPEDAVNAAIQQHARIGTTAPVMSTMPPQRAAAPGSAATTQQPSQTAAPSGPVQINDAASFHALPSGTQFLDPNGILRVKP